jgi:hypothetical protein
MGLLSRGRRAEARRELALLLKIRPRDPHAWVCAAWIEHDARDVGAMRAAVECAAKFGAPAATLGILRATAANAAGDMDVAIAKAQSAARVASGADKLLANAVLGESLYYADRVDDLATMLSANTDFAADPRGQLLTARVHRRRGRLDDAETALRAVSQGTGSPRVRRVAGAELAKLLDSQGKFAEAFAAAKEMHAATGAPFDTGGLVAELDATALLAARGGFNNMPRAASSIAPALLLCALPRCGTTLLEQMLDRHPAIRGLGESPAVGSLVPAFTSLGGWPSGVLSATPADLHRLRDGYVKQTRTANAVPPNIMTLDKSVRTWRSLPAVAAALPGAKLIRLTRDPRDTAVSVFLSPLDPRNWGWNSSLEDIKRVIAAERRCAPAIIKALQLDAIELRYEDLAHDPRAALQRVLQFLNLPWHEACLSPEGNPRVVITLSQEQVRRPVNTGAIGRWKNYAEHFDASWEQIDG